MKNLDDIVGEVHITPARKLEDLIRLAELCVDLLRQNEEFYAEVSPFFRGRRGREVMFCVFMFFGSVSINTSTYYIHSTYSIPLSIENKLIDLYVYVQTRKIGCATHPLIIC